MRCLRISVCLILGVLLCAPAVRAAEPSPDTSALSWGNTAFAFDLYGQLRKQNGNIFFSPLSVSSALAMVYGGAGGATASQMEKALRFPAKGEQLHQAYSALTRKIGEEETPRRVELRMANSLWPQEGAPLRDTYLETMKKYYGPSIFPVDFIKDEPSARARINDWVEKATKDKITNLIPSPLDPATRLLLVNAVYFKGTWLSTFDKELTKEGDFFTREGKIRVPLMNQLGDFSYCWEKGLQILELPYIDERTSMLVLLPGKASGALGKLEKSLSPKLLSHWRKKLSIQSVEVYLPKFTITWGAEPLSKHLVALGMRDAFSDKGDFSGITNGDPLFISDVVHKAFVDVNEEGTEAAAATGIFATSAGGDMRGPILFRADRPFLFLILDNSTGSILFMGRVMKPETK